MKKADGSNELAGIWYTYLSMRSVCGRVGIVERTQDLTQGVRRCAFPEHGDARGHLVVIEGGIDIPFEIKRLFYIYGSDADVARGQHANRRSCFILVNVAGSCKVQTLDGRGGEAVYVLDKPHEGIYLPPMIWKKMYDFSPDSLLLVLASEHYDPAEYIRDFDSFVREVKHGRTAQTE